MGSVSPKERQGGPRVDALLTLVATAAGLVVTLQTDRPASAIGVVAAVLVLLVFASCRAVTARTAGGERRYRRASPVLAIAWLVGGGLTGIAFGIAESRDFVIHRALGFEDLGAGIGTSPLRVLESKRAYRIAAVVNNKTSHEQLVSEVRLQVASEILPGGQRIACFADPKRYRIASRVQVSASGARFRVRGDEETKEGFSTEGTGRLNGYCTTSQVTVRFPTAIGLPAGEHAEIDIEIPRRFTVVEDRSPPSRVFMHRAPATSADVALPGTRADGDPVVGRLAIAFIVGDERGESISMCLEVDERRTSVIKHC